ncbi:uncharacterized protein LOC118481646 [Helianthus annuus]|uniref:uncharacterized protein LOC118481646 n=1 Tax=Helianthus annuus TaxID=4232 RepID=UPI001652FF57|nr:uncharacterized protein LOC118481646 [Helianthus annuus]
MNFLSLNVRGLGGDDKAGWIKGLKVKFGVCFAAFQETKCSAMDEKAVSRLWGCRDVGAEWVDSSGLSGGLVSVWDKNLFDFSDSIKERNFIITRGKIKGTGQHINIANIYAPQDVQAKKVLWDRLLDVIEGSTGLWVLLGDFNAVRTPEERLNTRFIPSCAGNFNFFFIFSARLLEYDMKNMKFTRWADKGRKGSKIDRVLVCPNFFGLWPNACLRALPRHLSDHSPIILVTKESNFRPKPFRVFNSLIGRPGFEKTVRDAASSFAGDGPADLFLLKKIEFIRSRIKEWRDELLKKEGELESTARTEIEDLEKLMEDRDLFEDEEWVLLENVKLVKEIEENKTKDLRQRSRVLNDFFSRGSVSRGCASAFITLIPKVRDPTGLNESRPISLIGAINKVVSKVLANRLKKVLGSVISENQSAFLSGKFILDGPLIINKTINWLKKNKRKAFLFKLDFEKAYDNVNWGFVISVMTQMGFPRLWCDWVFGILSAARAAVLVNGSPTFDFVKRACGKVTPNPPFFSSL